MSGATPRPNLWLVRPKPNPRPLIRLFCFPYAGGTAAAFRAWAEELPASIEVCAVQPPGRGGRFREAPFNNVKPLVQEAASALLPYLDRPFGFFGHSMGAIIAFEMARQLRREKIGGLLQLFVSGRRAAQCPSRRPPTFDLPEAEFMEHLRHLNGTPKEVLEHPQLMGLMLPLLRADFAVSQTYVYREEPPLDCPITSFRGAEDDEVHHEDVEAWREQTGASFSLRVFPGGHFFLQTSQTELLSIISTDLLNGVAAKRAEGSAR